MQQCSTVAPPVASAVVEAIAAAAARRSRRAFLRRSLWGLGAASAAGAGLLATPQASLARSRVPMSDDERNFKAITKHENDHVAFLVTALGANARPKPTFQLLEQDTVRHFFATSQVLENTGVGAYLGAAPFIDDPANLAAAGSIALIEGRHAGYFNNRLGDPITGNVMDLEADNSFEDALTASEVVAGAGVFIASLNGGPPVDYSTTPSPSNDIAILNFALALEYLEAEFYNINTAKFYG